MRNGFYINMINWIALVSLFFMLLITVKLIHYYSSRSAKFHIYFFVFIGYFLAFALVGLIPYDVYLATSEDYVNKEIEKELIYLLWTVIYWVGFGMCW